MSAAPTDQRGTGGVTLDTPASLRDCRSGRQVVAASYDRGDGRDDAGRVTEHLAIVGTQNDEAEGHQRLVPSEVGATVGRISMVRLAVALDEQPIADEQVGALAASQRQRRLRCRMDTRLSQKYA